MKVIYPIVLTIALPAAAIAQQAAENPPVQVEALCPEGSFAAQTVESQEAQPAGVAAQDNDAQPAEGEQPEESNRPPVGKEVGGAVGSTVGYTAGAVAGPVGAAAGGVVLGRLGEAVGGLFKKDKKDKKDAEAESAAETAAAPPGGQSPEIVCVSAPPREEEFAGPADIPE